MDLLPILPLFLFLLFLSLVVALPILKFFKQITFNRDLLVRFLPVLLWIALLVVFIFGIRSLLKTTPHSTPMTASGIPIFEPFQEKVAANVTEEPESKRQKSINPMTDPKSLTIMLYDAMTRIEKAMEILASMGDATCALVKEAEEGYVGSMSGDVDESEYSLPTDQIQERRQARMTRAKETFKRLRVVHASTRSKLAPLECFQDVATVVPVDTDVENLRAAVLEMATLLENQEVIASMNAADQMMIALQFTDGILKKASSSAEGFQTSSSPSSSTEAENNVASTESTVSGLNKDQLIALAISLLQKEQQLTKQVNDIQTFQKSLRAFTDEKYQKANRLQSGKVTMDDINSSQTTWLKTKSAEQKA